MLRKGLTEKMSELKKQDKLGPLWVPVVAAGSHGGELQVLMGELSGRSGGKADETLKGKEKGKRDWGLERL